jgi:hypothetical protein
LAKGLFGKGTEFFPGALERGVGEIEVKKEGQPDLLSGKPENLARRLCSFF